MTIRIFITTLVLVLATQTTLAEADGPFGLGWGMTKADVTGLGVRLEPYSAEQGLEIMKAKELPKNLSIAEGYALTFDKDKNLQRVQMVSETIEADPFGTKVKELYAGLKASLIKKYGEPSLNIERVGAKLYDESDEFYQCLAYVGCGMWSAGFEPKESDVHILLTVKGLGRGIGYISITYEGPKWYDIVDAINARKSESDSNAL